MYAYTVRDVNITDRAKRIMRSTLIAAPCISLRRLRTVPNIKGFTAVFAAGFCQAFAATLNYTMMVVWLGSPKEGVCPALSMGEGIYYAWLLLVAYDLVELLFKPLISLLSDKAGWKTSLVASTVFQTLSPLALMWEGFPGLLASRVFQGVASSISPTLMALVSGLTEDGGRYIGLYMGFRGLGYLTAPLLIAVSGELGKLHVILLTLALVPSQLYPLTAGLKPVFRKTGALSRGESRREIYGLMVLTALASMLLGVRFTLIPVVMLRRGFTSRIVGAMISLGFLVCLIGQMASGLLLDERYWIPLAFVGFTMSALGLVYMPHVGSLLDLLGVALTVTLGSSLTMVSTNTLLARRLLRLNIASTLGLNGLAQSMGELMGLTAIASLTEVDLNLAIASTVVAALTGSLFSALIHRRASVRLSS